MFGSAADTDDVLGELAADGARPDPATVAHPRAYLVRIVTRHALNRLRSSRARARTTSVRGCPSRCAPHRMSSTTSLLAESVSLAMLVVLESLAPPERAVFVLREVFGFDYDEIAAAVVGRRPPSGRSPTAPREHVQARRPPLRTGPRTGRGGDGGFQQACSPATSRV